MLTRRVRIRKISYDVFSYGPSQNGSINEGEIVFIGESIARKDFPDNRSYEKMREDSGNTMAMIFQIL